jgi:hypothetical protein
VAPNEVVAVKPADAVCRKLQRAPKEHAPWSHMVHTGADKGDEAGSPPKKEDNGPVDGGGTTTAGCLDGCKNLGAVPTDNVKLLLDGKTKAGEGTRAWAGVRTGAGADAGAGVILANSCLEQEEKRERERERERERIKKKRK